MSSNLSAMPTASVRGYAICTTPRSGSNYLCELLSSTGRLGRPLEYFNPQGRRALETPDYPDDPSLHLERILTSGCTDNGVYALKMFPNQLARALDKIPVFDKLPNVKFVWLNRYDLLGQAISWARAIQTGQFRASQRASGPAAYDGALISRCLSEIACANAAWAMYFARRDIAPLCIRYEDIEIDARAAIREVARLVDVNAEDSDLSRASVTKQRDDLNSQWRRTFQSQNGSPNVLQLVQAVGAVSS